MLCWSFGVSVYLIFMFLPSYLHTFFHVKLSVALSALSLVIIFMMLLIPLFGHLSDKAGRKPILFISLIGFVIFSYPLFSLMVKNTF